MIMVMGKKMIINYNDGVDDGDDDYNVDDNDEDVNRDDNHDDADDDNNNGG